MSLFNDRGQLSRRKLQALADTVAANDRTLSPGGLTNGDARMVRGPFGFQVRNDTPIPFWARITDTGTGLVYRLTAAASPEDETIQVEPPEELASDPPSLTAPFGIVVNNEAMTVTGFGEEGSGSESEADSTSGIWRVDRPEQSGSETDDVATPTTHPVDSPVAITGTRPLAWQSLRQSIPGAWQDHDEGPASPKDEDTGEIDIPAFEVSGQAVAPGTVVLMWLADSRDYYWCAANVGAPLWARITGADVVEGLVIDEDDDTSYAVFTQASPYRLANLDAAIGTGDDTVTVDDDSLLPGAVPYYIQVNEEVMLVTGQDSGELTVQRAQLGTITPGSWTGDEDLAPPDHEEGDAVYLFRIRYAWTEQTIAAGCLTDKPDGMTDQNYLIPAYETSNALVPIDGGTIVQLFPVPTGSGLFYLFQRPGGLLMTRFDQGEPDAENQSHVPNVGVINVDTVSGVDVAALGAGGVVLGCLPASGGQSGVVTAQQLLGFPGYQQLGRGSKSADAWCVSNGTTSVPGIASSGGASGWYMIDLTTGDIGDPAPLEVGDLSASGDITATGDLEADNFVGTLDGGTWT